MKHWLRWLWKGNLIACKHEKSVAAIQDALGILDKVIQDNARFVEQRIMALEASKTSERLARVELEMEWSKEALREHEQRLNAVDPVALYQRVSAVEAKQASVTELTTQIGQLHAAMESVRELREAMKDPKNTPQRVRTSRQFVALMEAE